MRSEPSVLVVGAGPVGCIAALLLVTKGIRVTLIEAATTLPEDLRASTFHPPTLDMLAPLGVTRHLIDNGLIADRYQYRDRSVNLLAEFDLSVLAGIVEHPFRVQCEQFKLTRHVVGRLEAMDGAEVRLGTQLTRVEQDDGRVRATVEHAGATEVIEADYLIGCDGAGSLVRQLIGGEFKGFTYPEQFLVVATDSDLQRNLPHLAQVNYVSGDAGWCVVLRTVGNWRVLFPIDPDDRRDILGDLDGIEALLQDLCPQPDRHVILHKSLYRIQQRVAQSWRRGRLLIAGDAAHLNNPLGGMGMNGGLHDAFNLCGKLTEVLCRSAAPALLDLYERQRRTVTEEVIQQRTIENKKKIERRDRAARTDWILQLKRVAEDRADAIGYLRAANMIDSLERAAEIR